MKAGRVLFRTNKGWQLRQVLIIVVVFCAGLGAAAQFGKISVLFDDLTALYAGHGPVAMGWMVSIVGLVGLILGAVAGMVIGSLGLRRVMVAALLLAAGASAAQALLPPYPAMMALRVVEGLSHLAIVVVGPVLMARASTPGTLGFVMALWGSFFGLSYAGLAYVVPLIVESQGLGAVFLAHAIWMAACATVLVALLPADPPRTPVPRGDWLGRHLRIYASPRISTPAMGFICYTILFVALLTLLPTHVPQDARATVAFWMPLGAIIVSLTLGVWVLRRLSAVRTVQLGFVIAALAVIGLWSIWGQAWPMAGMALALSGAFGLVQGASFAAIAQLNAAPEDRAMAAGALAQMGNLGTVTGTPLLAWAFAHGEAGAILAMGLPCCLAGIAIHAVQARRRMQG
jgi:MFS transporter, DHA1 family, inner membrane transport protein